MTGWTTSLLLIIGVQYKNFITKTLMNSWRLSKLEQKIQPSIEKIMKALAVNAALVLMVIPSKGEVIMH